MKGFIFIFIFMASVLAAFAQDGKVEIIGAKELDKRISDRIQTIDTNDLEGYRIQLFFGTDMLNAQKVRANFIAKYPEMSKQTYMPYSQPYWRVRVGNFYTQLEAQEFFRKLESDFGSVFLVKDRITIPSLH